MKTVFIGDVHGRSDWRLITRLERADRVVFTGDYFDSFDFSGAEQMYNFKAIVEYKKSGESEVVMLIGNHDYHYFPWIGRQRTSGYQSGIAMQIGQLLKEDQHHLQMCYEMDNILCSHAGIGHDWLVYQNQYSSGSIADFVNDIWKYQPRKFAFNDCNFDDTGDSKTQTPIWIRPRSLMAGNKGTFLKKDYIQIVGHTQVKCIDIQGKATGGKYFFIDALAVGEYLVLTDGVFTLGTVKKSK